MSAPIKIGMIGLDTSHVIAFTKLLNNAGETYHVPGGQVVAGFPGGSPDFELSYSRVDGFTSELRDKFGIAIVDSPEAVAELCDAVMLESADGRVHLEQFRSIVTYGKPVFIDKPLAVSYKDASEIVELSKRYSVPIMSASALRFAEGLELVHESKGHGDIIGADIFGPMAIQPTQPGLFWYGVHMTDMLYRLFGKGCVEVKAATKEHHDVIVGTWSDGRIGTIRGNRMGNHEFGGIVHRERHSDFIDIQSHTKPYYASLLEAVIEFFRIGKPMIDPEETLEIIRFMEAANESRESGKSIKLWN